MKSESCFSFAMASQPFGQPPLPPIFGHAQNKGCFLLMPSQYTDYRVSQKKFITFTFLTSQEFWSKYKFILKKTLFGTPCRFQSKGFNSHKISSKISGARCDFVVRKWEWHVWSKRIFLRCSISREVDTSFGRAVCTKRDWNCSFLQVLRKKKG